MKFNDVYVNTAERFAIGIEEESGRYYVSFPVRNGYAEYEEYYALGRAQFDLFQRDGAAALAFVTRCRNREKDELLIVKPGRLRGVAC
ncbi:hypothetical protein NX784_02450 [Massilia pinisoli]|uniref:KTSC domain-containing protein n=1 Tax=Massilia pinisoli TaxID=1772194 RepID=A0ABT1ZKN0_9BURK|nr:hypothetical protein [Massilia pinisoli]MCS0580440.1 hypothetical protein [Massilia pinisoli]